MRIARATNFAGLANSFPSKIQPAVNDLIRRLELEFDSLYRILQDSSNASRDASNVLAIADGQRLYISKPDGTKELVEVSFPD